MIFQANIYRLRVSRRAGVRIGAISAVKTIGISPDTRLSGINIPQGTTANITMANKYQAANLAPINFLIVAIASQQSQHCESYRIQQTPFRAISIIDVAYNKL